VVIECKGPGVFRLYPEGPRRLDSDNAVGEEVLGERITSGLAVIQAEPLDRTQKPVGQPVKVDAG
jgi:hypothetical protein